MEDKWRPFKLQHYWEQLEYWEESWRLVVTQTPEKNHQLKLKWKNSQGVNNNNNNLNRLVFTNGPGNPGSIPGQVIPKTLKMVLMPPYLTLSLIRYRSRVKSRNPGKGVAPFPTPWCSSYQKGSLWVTFDYGRQLYFYFYKR